jgi:hypothetical protein
VQVRDRVWQSATKSYVRPLPRRVGVSPRGHSRRLERVLTDFGCEHSFAKAAETASAVRTVTLEHAQRAQAQLEEGYAQSFRILPKVGAEHAIAEADGTLIRTVEPGKRKGKRPRQWKEMRLVAAQAKDSARTIYGATFGKVEAVGRRLGHCAREAGWGWNSQIHAVGRRGGMDPVAEW